MADQIDHNQRTHSRIGPSQAERVWHCAASVQMIEKYGVERDPGQAAVSGTWAHELAERTLRKQGVIEGDDAMADAARGFVAVVEGEVEASSPEHVLLIEERVDLQRHHPELFGTMDAALFDPARRRLFIFDLKTGRSLVEADALQLKLYAAMTLELLRERGIDPDQIETVETVIVQPYARHADGAVRRARHMRGDIITTAGDYVERAYRATHANEMPEATAGKWCRWCAARAQCMAFRTEQTRLAGVEFGPDGAMTTTLPEVNEIPAEHLGRMLQAAWMMRPWIAALEQRCLFLMAELGASIPGWMLKDKRATRKWTDPERAERRLRAMGLPSDRLFEHKFISPAQAEKLLRLHDRSAIADLIVSEISGKTLAAQPILADSVLLAEPDNLEN